MVDNATGDVVASGWGSSFSFTPGEEPDSYTATMTATDEYGVSGTGSTIISVVDNPPSVSLSASPQTQNAGSVGTVYFSGSVSGSSNTYNESWQVVDNATGDVVASGTGESFSFTPGEDADSYTATMTATDEYNVSGTGSTTIVINDSAPGVSLSATPQTQNADQVGVVNFSASVTAYAPLSSESWQIVDNATGGVVAWGTGETFSFTPGQQPDSYTATFTATDVEGLTSSGSVTIGVVDNLSVSLSASPQTQNADQVGTVNFTGSVSGTTSFNESWQIVDNATGDVVAWGGGSSFSFTPGEQPDSYTATLSVSDEYGVTGSASVTISVVDNLSVSLSASPQTQNADQVGLVSFSGSVSGTTSLSENWQIVDNATNQVVASGTGSSFSFTPGEGPDSYTATLTVTDEYGVSSSASATTSVVDNAPSVSLSASPQTQDADAVGAVNFTGTLSGTTTTSFSESWQIVDNATGDVVASGTGTSFSFTPGADADSYTATLTATDEYGVSASASTTININDDAPSVSLSASPQTQTADQVGTVNFSASVTAYASLNSENWQVVDNATGEVVASGSGKASASRPAKGPIVTRPP